MDRVEISGKLNIGEKKEGVNRFHCLILFHFLTGWLFFVPLGSLGIMGNDGKSKMKSIEVDI
jgi:hypothetical protein